MFTLSEEGYRQLRLQQARLDIERKQMDQAKFLLKQEKKAEELKEYKLSFFPKNDSIEMIEFKKPGVK